MDALGLFSSGLFSGYTIIWAGGGTINMGKFVSAANGSFLIITSGYGNSNSGGTSKSLVMFGFMIIANGKSAYCGGIGYSNDNSPGFESGFIGVKYSGSNISCIDNDSMSFSGFIIA